MIENQELMKEALSVINQKTFKADLELIFPLNEGQAYIGSLCNHYRGKLKNYGVDGLINSMCNNSLKAVIAFYKKSSIR